MSLNLGSLAVRDDIVQSEEADAARDSNAPRVDAAIPDELALYQRCSDPVVRALSGHAF